ncbi:MAG: hypothetical protein O2923_05155 [Verrucomicrobia bacterium]|nr:hypothetical protein [Verrucomicrobiota bacterium]MDA1087102.1 hypothetical protein [Verrucomicrobiota bacterium]
MKARAGAPLFLIDIAAPADIDPGVASLPNVFLFTTDDLAQVVSENTATRAAAATKAAVIIDEETDGISAWFDGLEIRPRIRRLRAMYEEIVALELAAIPGEVCDEERGRMQRLSHALLNKFLHAPLTSLRRISEQGDGPSACHYADLIFGLSETD